MIHSSVAAQDCCLFSVNIDWFVSPVGQVVTEEKIQQAKLIYQLHFKQSVFDEEGWRRILEVKTLLVNV